MLVLIREAYEISEQNPKMLFFRVCMKTLIAKPDGRMDCSNVKSFVTGFVKIALEKGMYKEKGRLKCYIYYMGLQLNLGESV